MRREEAKSAAEGLLAAALLGEGWADALQHLAEAAEAGGASLVHIQTGRSLAHLSSTEWADSEAEIMAGQVPPSPLWLYPDHVYGAAFASTMMSGATASCAATLTIKSSCGRVEFFFTRRSGCGRTSANGSR